MARWSKQRDSAFGRAMKMIGPCWSTGLQCPIWTEDADFFGTGVATWTTDRVELLLHELGAATPEELDNEI